MTARDAVGLMSQIVTRLTGVACKAGSHYGIEHTNGNIMNDFTRLVALGLISAGPLLAGCTTEGPAASRAQLKSVPDISVVIDCGDCQVRSSVPEAIHKGYIAAALKAGVPIAGDAKVTLTIKDYTERGLAERSAIFVVSLLVPPVALVLKDEIKADALVDGKRMPLEYHYRVPFRGIEAVAQKLGERTFEAVDR